MAHASLGDVSEEEVEGIRTGQITDPTVGQVAALAAVFGVAPAFLLDRGTEPSVLDEGVLEALAGEMASAILRESARLPEREKIVLGIVRQFANQSDLSESG